MIDRKCTWTATQQDQQHRCPLDMGGPGHRIDENFDDPTCFQRGWIAMGMGLALSVGVFSEVSMLGIPRRFSHFVYGVIQSGLTCAIAAGIASFPFAATGTFVTHWLQSWFVAWIMMLPIVLFAAPAIRNLTHILTRED